MKDYLYSTSEAAALIGISRATLLRRIKSGDIVPDRTDRITHYHAFSRHTINAYLSTRYAQNSSKKVLSDIAGDKFTFIDLFAGIGGIRLGFEAAGGECLFSSEIDKYAVKTYSHMFADRKEHTPVGDITQVEADDIPPHDFLLGGFPCQPFSIAGVSKYQSLGWNHGFQHPTKGTLFFHIARLLAHHKPKGFFLENVKNLMSHDRGRTWQIIRQTLEELGYDVHARIYDAQLVVPQHRERIFIVGFRKDLGAMFSFPEIENRNPKLVDILDPEPDEKYTLSDHLWNYLQAYAAKHKAAGNGFGYGIADPNGVTRTLSARYHKDGSEILIAQKGKNPRRLTPAECARLQGFPERWQHPVVSDTQAYRQFGNAVAVPLIEEVAIQMAKYLALSNKTGGQPRETA